MIQHTILLKVHSFVLVDVDNQKSFGTGPTSSLALRAITVKTETSCTEHGTKRLLGFEVGAKSANGTRLPINNTTLYSNNIYNSRTHLFRETIILTTPKPKYIYPIDEKWCASSLPSLLPSCWRSLPKELPSFLATPIATVSNICTLTFILATTPTKTFAQMFGWIWKDFKLRSQDLFS